MLIFDFWVTKKFVLNKESIPKHKPKTNKSPTKDVMPCHGRMTVVYVSGDAGEVCADVSGRFAVYSDFRG